MKGVFTLGIYIAIGITGAAFGQSTDHVKTIKTVPMPVTGSDHAKTTVARHPPMIELVPPPPKAPSATPERIVITYGAGGSIYEHNLKFWGYRQGSNEVEIRGPCYSACTLITAYVGKDKLCIAQGAFFGFHAVRTAKWPPEIMPAETDLTYRQQPPEIRDWIDRNGGPDKLPLHGYWTMYDHDLWALGYPKCK
jgi:hypothetical protein